MSVGIVREEMGSMQFRYLLASAYVPDHDVPGLISGPQMLSVVRKDRCVQLRRQLMRSSQTVTAQLANEFSLFGVEQPTNHVVANAGYEPLVGRKCKVTNPLRMIVNNAQRSMRFSVPPDHQVIRAP